MKALLCTLMLATLGVAAAKADPIAITFDQPNQTALPGQTVQFFGTITNLTDATVYLNNDDINLYGLSLATNDQFFNTVPISLAPGGSSGDIDLFDVAVSAPLLDAPGTFTGDYTLFGGADGNAQDSLGSTGISVTTKAPTPEPSTVYLLLTGTLGTLVPISRRWRARAA